MSRVRNWEVPRQRDAGRRARIYDLLMKYNILVGRAIELHCQGRHVGKTCPDRTGKTGMWQLEFIAEVEEAIQELQLIVDQAASSVAHSTTQPPYYYGNDCVSQQDNANINSLSFGVGGNAPPPSLRRHGNDFMSQQGTLLPADAVAKEGASPHLAYPSQEEAPRHHRQYTGVPSMATSVVSASPDLGLAVGGRVEPRLIVGTESDVSTDMVAHVDAGATSARRALVRANVSTPSDIIAAGPAGLFAGHIPSIQHTTQMSTFTEAPSLNYSGNDFTGQQNNAATNFTFEQQAAFEPFAPSDWAFWNQFIGVTPS